jgi:hypothetical protein
VRVSDGKASTAWAHFTVSQSADPTGAGTSTPAPLDGGTTGQEIHLGDLVATPGGLTIDGAAVQTLADGTGTVVVDGVSLHLSVNAAGDIALTSSTLEIDVDHSGNLTVAVSAGAVISSGTITANGTVALSTGGATSDGGAVTLTGSATITGGDLVSAGTTSGGGGAAHTNHAPTVAVHDAALAHDQIVAAGSFFTATDSDNDALTYELWQDGGTGGHFAVNGAVQPMNQAIALDQAQLAQSTFQWTGGTPASLWVRASDGQAMTDWAHFRVTDAGNHAPVLTAVDATLALNQSVAVGSLISASDADHDPLGYELWQDGGTGGHFTVNGAAQEKDHSIVLTQAELAAATFDWTGGAPGSLWARAYDGHAYSDWSHFAISGS